jgi:thioredoxin 1
MADEGTLEHLNDDNFEDEVLKADKPVLVDCWAPWCGPCVALSPIVEELAREYENRVKVVKLNVDDSRNTAAKFGIRGIPTLLLFKAGKLEDTMVGLVSKERLEDFIKKVL